VVVFITIAHQQMLDQDIDTVMEELYTTTIIENIKLGSIIDKHNGNKKESICSLFYFGNDNVILPSITSLKEFFSIFLHISTNFLPLSPK
jgi:hypothetical protein